MHVPFKECLNEAEVLELALAHWKTLDARHCTAALQQLALRSRRHFGMGPRVNVAVRPELLLLLQRTADELAATRGAGLPVQHMAMSVLQVCGAMWHLRHPAAIAASECLLRGRVAEGQQALQVLRVGQTLAAFLQAEEGGAVRQHAEALLHLSPSIEDAVRNATHVTLASNVPVTLVRFAALHAAARQRGDGEVQAAAAGIMQACLAALAEAGPLPASVLRPVLDNLCALSSCEGREEAAVVGRVVQWLGAAAEDEGAPLPPRLIATLAQREPQLRHLTAASSSAATAVGTAFAAVAQRLAGTVAGHAVAVREGRDAEAATLAQYLSSCLQWTAALLEGDTGRRNSPGSGSSALLPLLAEALATPVQPGSHGDLLCRLDLRLSSGLACIAQAGRGGGHALKTRLLHSLPFHLPSNGHSATDSLRVARGLAQLATAPPPDCTSHSALSTPLAGVVGAARAALPEAGAPTGVAGGGEAGVTHLSAADAAAVQSALLARAVQGMGRSPRLTTPPICCDAALSALLLLQSGQGGGADAAAAPPHADTHAPAVAAGQALSALGSALHGNALGHALCLAPELVVGAATLATAAGSTGPQLWLPLLRIALCRAPLLSRGQLARVLAGPLLAARVPPLVRSASHSALAPTHDTACLQLAGWLAQAPGLPKVKAWRNLWRPWLKQSPKAASSLDPPPPLGDCVVPGVPLTAAWALALRPGPDGDATPPSTISAAKAVLRQVVGEEGGGTLLHAAGGWALHHLNGDSAPPAPDAWFCPPEALARLYCRHEVALLHSHAATASEEQAGVPLGAPDVQEEATRLTIAEVLGDLQPGSLDPDSGRAPRLHVDALRKLAAYSQ